MADFDEVVKSNGEHLADIGESTTHFKTLSERLGKLGYDVLLNHKEKAEFVPSGRLNDVVSQRDTFKTQVQELNKQMQSMKDAAKGNDELQGNLQKLMDQNQGLLTELENTKVNTELMLAANDAVNPKDVLVFVNRENLKMSAKGEVMGIESEINRIKTEKPYLFKSIEQKKKGGSDTSAGDGEAGKLNMNFLIRRAAGK